jgi:hypothetical protein
MTRLAAAKAMGFSDVRVATLTGTVEDDVRRAQPPPACTRSTRRSTPAAPSSPR